MAQPRSRSTKPYPRRFTTRYRLTFQLSLGNVVWRDYKVANPYIAAQMQQVFPYPFAFRNSDGTAAAMTSAPVCTVYWSNSGSPPYNQSTVGVQINPTAGTITTVTPTALMFGGGVITPPSDVQVFLPVANGMLQVQAPTSGYAGTLYTVEGISRTKTVTVREWKDYSLNANMQTYANSLLASYKNVVVEGTLPYLGLATLYLTPGQAVSIAGSSYTTGYESLALPVACVDVQFNPGPGGTFYMTTLHLSNRQARYTGDVFVRPAMTGQSLGLESAAISAPLYASTAGEALASAAAVQAQQSAGLENMLTGAAQTSSFDAFPDAGAGLGNVAGQAIGVGGGGSDVAENAFGGLPI